MADPVLTGVRRALAIFQNLDNLPESRYINSWCFDDVGGIGADVQLLADRLRDFYTLTHTGATGSIWSTLLAGGILKNSLEVRVYDLGQQPPRVPQVFSYTLAANSATPTVEEAALVASMVAERNQPRRRGRVYIGPLQTGVVTFAGGRVIPLAARVTNVVKAMDFLKGNNVWRLCVLSHADAAARAVTGGWVDNAFDTQRRRGVEANSREQYGTYTS